MIKQSAVFVFCLMFSFFGEGMHKNTTIVDERKSPNETCIIDACGTIDDIIKGDAEEQIDPDCCCECGFMLPFKRIDSDYWCTVLCCPDCGKPVDEELLFLEPIRKLNFLQNNDETSKLQHA